MALLLRLAAALLLLLGLPRLDAAAPPRPTCYGVFFDKAAGTLNLEVILAAANPAISSFTAKAALGSRTVAPVPLLWTGDSRRRVNVTFPASAFVSQPDGRYVFSAAAVNADGTSEDCINAIPYTVARPAKPGLLGVTATCDTVKVEFTRPPGVILINDYDLTVDGRTKLSPYLNTVVGGKKLLYFPTWPFTAGRHSVVLAAKSIFGTGAPSQAVAYTHVPCDTKVVTLEQALRNAEGLADSAMRNNTALATQLEAARSDNTTCSSQLLAAKSDPAAAATANATCGTDLSQCRTSLANCQASNGTLASGNADLAAQLAACEAANRTLADSNAGLTAQLSQCKANLTSADGQLAECVRQRDTCTTAKDGLQTSLDTCNKDKAAAAAQCNSDKASLQTSLDSCNTRRAQCNTDKAQCTTDKASCEANKAALTSECSGTLSSLSANPTCALLGSLKTECAAGALSGLSANLQCNKLTTLKTECTGAPSSWPSASPTCTNVIRPGLKNAIDLGTLPATKSGTAVLAAEPAVAGFFECTMGWRTRICQGVLGYGSFCGGDPKSAGMYGPQMVFQFTETAVGGATRHAATCGCGYDSVLLVFEAGPGGAEANSLFSPSTAAPGTPFANEGLTFLKCGDDEGDMCTGGTYLSPAYVMAPVPAEDGTDLTAYVEFQTQQDNVYYIILGDYNGQSINYKLDVW